MGKPRSFFYYGQLPFYKPFCFFSECRGRVQFLAVDREHRQKGYARKLLTFALEDALRHGMCIVELVIRVSNHSAQRLYRKLGFKQTWQAEGFVGFEKSLI